METERIQHIIRSFFGKRFGKEMQLRFRYWFRSEEDRDMKEMVMEELWESSLSEVTLRTWSDLSDIRRRIGQEVKPLRRSIFYGWGKYAAVVVLILATVVSTRLLTPVEFREISPELVEFFVPYGDCRQVKLADGSSVWVNAGSLLVYPKEFTSGLRKIYLSGEARFEVASNPEKPFIVSTQHLDVEALGTVFSVEAYPNARNTIATLEEGSVRVDTKTNVLSASILKPNEQLIYTHLTGQVTINTVDATQRALWKDGYLIFEDASFEQLVTALERKYNVTINYNAEKYKGRSYYVKFGPDETLEDTLVILSQLIENFQFKMIDKTVIIN